MKLINSIAKLPLSTFIDCFVDHDYSGLVTEGEAPESLLLLTFNDLVEQYNDAISKGDDSQRQYISAFQEYQRAKARHDLAIKYIELLNAYFEMGVVVPKWIKELNRLCDIQYKFDVNKKEEFTRYLERCFSRNKANLIKYQLAEMQLSQIMQMQQAGGSSQIEMDRGYFIQIMLNLKSMEKREIPYDISTLEFCMLVNRYREHIKYFQDQKEKTKR